MTVVLPQLPQPGASQQEVLFRRMLLQCSRRIQGTPEQQNTKDWRTDAKFHCVLDSLQERLYDLEHASADVRPSPDVLQQYIAAVRAITSQLQVPQLPSYCLRASADRLPAADVASAAGKSNSSGSREPQHLDKSGQDDHSQQQQQQRQKQQPQASRTAAGTAASAGRDGGNSTVDSTARASGGGDAPSFSLSNQTRTMLTTQQRLQDELTDELLDMGAELKSSTLAMQNAIRYRGKLLDDTEVSLINSTENAKAVAAKAKEQYKQGNWNLCHTCIIVLSVFIIFTVMLVVIRVSSMVGLKGS